MGCGSLLTFPDQLSQEERFAQLRKTTAPLEDDVAIYWDEHSIPFVEAKNDSDLAFGVGVTHGHLRIDQLELMRILSQGRISEVAGPLPQTKLIDHGLRLLGLRQSAENSIKAMDSHSRKWMERFTEGVNWYISQLKEEPATNRLFDLKLEPYTLLDMMIISRLITLDLAWATYLQYIKAAEKPGWKKAFEKSKKRLSSGTPSFDNGLDKLSSLFRMFSKSGSNSIVISGNKTQSGSSLIASDPHVGLLLPNFWILVGIKSPNYHAMGYMIPGVPVIGVGRNKDIAWGGTNMRSISSHLYDVTDLSKEKVKVREEKLKRRWWFPTRVKIRETDFGPILTDLPYFDQKKIPFVGALDWVGRKGSDEIGAFLKVARSKNWPEFKEAFRTYKVSAFNMLYGDKKGNIGMVSAYGQPVLKKPEHTLDFLKTTDNPIVDVVNSVDHPNPYNPKSGFIATANNKPYAKPKIPFAFEYSKNHRVERLMHYGRLTKPLTTQDMKDLQLDIFSQKAFDIKNRLASALPSDPSLKDSEFMRNFEKWDGRYNHDSRSVLFFYSLVLEIWPQYLEEVMGPGPHSKRLKESAYWKDDLIPWLDRKTDPQVIGLIKKALPKAQKFVDKYDTWGDLHRQVQTTPLGQIPGIGRRFRFPTYPVDGAAHTVHKSERLFNHKVQKVFYGSSARHISDMSSIDENYFVMHGGQDSWTMNANINDQTPLWRRGEYIKIPLSMPLVKTHFSKKQVTLKPDAL